MNLFFENMKWLRGSSSSGKGVDEKVVVKVMTILMMVMMILIIMVILMIILMMVMMILNLQEMGRGREVVKRVRNQLLA